MLVFRSTELPVPIPVGNVAQSLWECLYTLQSKRCVCVRDVCPNSHHIPVDWAGGLNKCPSLVSMLQAGISVVRCVCGACLGVSSLHSVYHQRRTRRCIMLYIVSLLKRLVYSKEREGIISSVKITRMNV